MVFIDTSVFSLPMCASSIVVDKIEGRKMTASIVPFNQDLYYSLHFDGTKVIDNIKTPTFEYILPFLGHHNVYIISSTKSTINSFQCSIPSVVKPIHVQ